MSVAISPVIDFSACTLAVGTANGPQMLSSQSLRHPVACMGGIQCSSVMVQCTLECGLIHLHTIPFGLGQLALRSWLSIMQADTQTFSPDICQYRGEAAPQGFPSGVGTIMPGFLIVSLHKAKALCCLTNDSKGTIMSNCHMCTLLISWCNTSR